MARGAFAEGVSANIRSGYVEQARAHEDVERVAARTERTWKPALASTVVLVLSIHRCDCS